MKDQLKSVLVLGLGKVGTLVGILLEKTGFQVTDADFLDKGKNKGTLCSI